MKNDIYEVEQSIMEEVKKIAGEKFKYIHGYLQESDYKDRLQSNTQENDIPYILLRAGDIEHKREAIGFVKQVKFLLQITTKKENVETGYKEILDITNKIIEMLAENSFKLRGYSIADTTIKAVVNDYYTAGNYWSYDITFGAELYPAQTGELCKRLGM